MSMSPERFDRLGNRTGRDLGKVSWRTFAESCPGVLPLGFRLRFVAASYNAAGVLAPIVVRCTWRLTMRNWIAKCFARPFTPVVWAFLPVSVAINLAVGTLVQVIKLPVFLDSIGTVIMAVLAGPVPAILAGLITVAVGGLITNPVLPWFAGTAIAIGWFSGFCANRGAFRRSWTSAACGLAQGVIAAVVSAPVIVGLFGGITQSGASVVVAYLLATGETVLKSVILAGVACEPVDKALTFLIVHAVLKGIPQSLSSYFPRAQANLNDSVQRGNPAL